VLPPRSIKEWDHIAYGDGEHQLPLWAADRLAAVANATRLGGSEKRRILEHGRTSLRAGQVVGVIVAEGCSLEILPKIHGLADDVIRHRLVNMLAVAMDLDVASGRLTSLGWQRDNLLEILIGLFAAKLTDAVRLGMPRRYVPHEEDLPALRGRLDATRQFTSLAASPQKLASRFDELSVDIALNQIMQAAVRKLQKLSRSQSNQRSLRELSFAYADVTPHAQSRLRWDLVVLDRTNMRWRELLDLAQLLLGEKFQTTTSGADQGFSLLFEMNTLFERYVAKMLQRAARSTPLRVVAQQGGMYCLTELDGGQSQRFHTKPDIRVLRGNETVLVIDTKWKRLSRRVDDPKQGISQADIYQMMAYGELYRSDHLMLLYPHHAGLGETDGITSQHQITRTSRFLSTATIDVGRREHLAERLLALVTAQLDLSPAAPALATS